MFKRVLIANRGEIALRVIRACSELGIETVAVYSEVDEDALHLRFADETICIGPGPSRSSYLDIPRIIAAAEITDVDAIHPGYGFLSENPRFAQVCRDCKIGFIGPSPEAMLAVGDKARARALAISAGVPVVPGSDGVLADVDAALLAARTIGFPVMIKGDARRAHGLPPILQAGWTEIEQDATIAVRPARGADRSSVSNQQMCPVGPLFTWHDLHQFALCLDGLDRVGQPEAERQARRMRVDRNALSQTVGIAEHDVRSLATRAGHRFEFAHRPRDFAPMLVQDAARCANQRLGLITEETR